MLIKEEKAFPGRKKYLTMPGNLFMLDELPITADGICSPVSFGAAAMRRQVHGFFYALQFMAGEVSGSREACRTQSPVCKPDISSAALILITPDGGKSPYRSMTMLESIIDQSNPEKTALYRHYDADNQLLYVGISISTIHRFKDHKLRSDWAYLSVRIDMQWFDSREEAVEAERHAIINEHPRFNIVHSLFKESKKHEEKPAGLPFQRLNINKYEILHKTNKLLAQAYLIECGVTPDYIQQQLSCLGSSAPVFQGIGQDESIENLIERFINAWQTQLTSSTHLKERDSQVQPFMPERDASEKRLTSSHLSVKPGEMEIRSNSVPNGFSIFNSSGKDNDSSLKFNSKSRAHLYPPPEGRGFTCYLVIAVPFMPCLGTQALRLLHVWMDKNAIDIDHGDNRLMAAMYKHPAVYSKRKWISNNKFDNSRKVLMIKGEEPPVDMQSRDWLAENVQCMESILKNLEAN